MSVRATQFAAAGHITGRSAPLAASRPRITLEFGNKRYRDNPAEHLAIRWLRRPTYPEHSSRFSDDSGKASEATYYQALVEAGEAGR